MRLRKQEIWFIVAAEAGREEKLLLAKRTCVSQEWPNKLEAFQLLWALGQYMQ